MDLTGKLLIAMPGMGDPRFAHSVVYLCNHDARGAMGLIVNKPSADVRLSNLIEQLDIVCTADVGGTAVYFGGPVEMGRGFVLHSADFVEDATLVIDDAVALTATIDILKAIADGNGPQHSLLALGYAGWGPGQLDGELQRNGWLSVPADDGLIFGGSHESRWERAMAKLGIDITMLSGEAGHA